MNWWSRNLAKKQRKKELLISDLISFQWYLVLIMKHSQPLKHATMFTGASILLFDTEVIDIISISFFLVSNLILQIVSIKVQSNKVEYIYCFWSFLLCFCFYFIFFGVNFIEKGKGDKVEPRVHQVLLTKPKKRWKRLGNRMG